MAHRVPDADRRHGEPHVLFRRDRHGCQQRERPQPALVEVPPREQEQRARERNGVEVAHRQPLHRRREEVRNGERRRGPARADVLAARARRPAARRCATATAWTTSSSSGSGQSHQSGASKARIGSKCEPSREICSPWTSVTERKSPWAVDQTACVMLPRSKRPLSKARCLSTAARRRSPRRRRPRPRRAAGPASLREESLDETEPACAEHGLARLLAVGREPAGADRARELRVACEPAHGRSQRLGVAGRNEQRALAVAQQLACGGRVAPSRGVSRTRAPERPCSGSRGPSSRRCRTRRARTPRAGSPPAAARSRPSRPTRRSAGARPGARRAGRCRRHETGPRARGGPPSGSSRARAAGSACRRRARGTSSAGCHPGRKSRSSAPTKQTASRSSGSPASSARWRAFCSVSATTRSARRSAIRSM